MGRTPCCDKANVKKGPWSPEEDAKLKEYIEKHGTGGNWISLPQKAGLKRCGKSCRLRWLNYLRPDIKHGDFSEEEDRIICNLFATIGSRWSVIATQLAGRTDNDIKNYWNTKLKKKVMGINNKMIIPTTSQKHPFLQPNSSTTNSSSCSSPSSYSNHSNPSWSFSTLLDHPISLQPNLLNPTTLIHQQHQLLSQDQNFIINPMGDDQNYHVKADRLLVFGGEASCSSSDGSVVKGGDAEYGVGGGGVEAENRRRSMSFVECSSVNGWNNKQLEDGMWMETPLMDYGLEEIKQLIISSSSCCTNGFF